MPPHIRNTKIAQDNRIILSKGSKPENQHTRVTLGTLSWVYKPSNYHMVIGSSSPCWSYQSQDLWPAKNKRYKGMPLPCSLKKQAHTGQDGLLLYSSRQMEQVVMRSRPSTATASQHAIYQRK